MEGASKPSLKPFFSLKFLLFSPSSPFHRQQLSSTGISSPSDHGHFLSVLFLLSGICRSPLSPPSLLFCSPLLLSIIWNELCINLTSTCPHAQSKLYFYIRRSSYARRSWSITDRGSTNSLLLCLQQPDSDRGELRGIGYGKGNFSPGALPPLRYELQGRYFHLSLPLRWSFIDWCRSQSLTQNHTDL